MSGHSHDSHHASEQKPVAFAVPFYLAAATLVFVLFFLSLCDPKAHHEGGHGEHQATEATAGHGEATHEEHAATSHEASSAAAEAPEAVTTDEHTAEPAKVGSATAHH